MTTKSFNVITWPVQVCILVITNRLLILLVFWFVRFVLAISFFEPAVRCLCASNIFFIFSNICRHPTVRSGYAFKRHQGSLCHILIVWRPTRKHNSQTWDILSFISLFFMSLVTLEFRLEFSIARITKSFESLIDSFCSDFIIVTFCSKPSHMTTWGNCFPQTRNFRSLIRIYIHLWYDVILFCRHSEHQ